MELYLSISPVFILISACFVSVHSQAVARIVAPECEDQNSRCVSPPINGCDGITTNQQCMTTSQGLDSTGGRKCEMEEYEKLKYFWCSYEEFSSVLSSATTSACTLQGKCFSNIRFTDSVNLTLAELKDRLCNYAKDNRPCLDNNCTASDAKKAVDVYCPLDKQAVIVSENCNEHHDMCVSPPKDSCEGLKAKRPCMLDELANLGAKPCTPDEYNKLVYFHCKYEQLISVLSESTTTGCAAQGACFDNIRYMVANNTNTGQLKSMACRKARENVSCLKKACSEKDTQKVENVYCESDMETTDSSGRHDTPLTSSSAVMFIGTLLASSLLKVGHF